MANPYNEINWYTPSKYATFGRRFADFLINNKGLYSKNIIANCSNGNGLLKAPQEYFGKAANVVRFICAASMYFIWRIISASLLGTTEHLLFSMICMCGTMLGIYLIDRVITAFIFSFFSWELVQSSDSIQEISAELEYNCRRQKNAKVGHYVMSVSLTHILVTSNYILPFWCVLTGLSVLKSVKQRSKWLLIISVGLLVYLGILIITANHHIYSTLNALGKCIAIIAYAILFFDAL